MTQQNRWQQGVMYYQGRLNGTPFFTQPGGPGTQVFPANQRNTVWPDWPGAATMTINEVANWVNPGCQHVVKGFTIIREFDYGTGQSCALLTCPTCSYVQRAVEPFEGILDPYAYCVIVG